MEDFIKKEILELARTSISTYFKHKNPELSRYKDPIYLDKKGAFVTLHKHHELRGCIGYIVAFKSLLETINEMARAAAFKDPRFSPLRESELEEIRIEISVLSELIQIQTTDEIEVGRDGLLIEHPYGSGVLLPQVPLEYNWDKATYLKHLCRKAGLSDNSWTDKQSKIFRFSAEVFAEDDFMKIV